MLTMRDRIFRHIDLLACDSCGQEWFGAGGEAAARAHAAASGHQVRIEFSVRETLNEAAEASEPLTAAPVFLTAAEKRQSRERAIARLKRAGVLS